MAPEEWERFLIDSKISAPRPDGFRGAGERLESFRPKSPGGRRPAIGEGLTLAEFLSALCAAASARYNDSSHRSTPVPSSRLGTKRLRPLPACVAAVLKEHVTPRAARDTSHRFRASLAADAATRAALDGFATPLRREYESLLAIEAARPADGGGGGGVAGVGCGVAVEWLRRRGGLGEPTVRPKPLTRLHGHGVERLSSERGAATVVRSTLSAELACGALMDALPLNACLPAAVSRFACEVSSPPGSPKKSSLSSPGSPPPATTTTTAAAATVGSGAYLRSFAQFEEWLVRCGELKFGGLATLGTRARAKCMLRNVVDGDAPAALIAEARDPPAAKRFDAKAFVLPKGGSREVLALCLRLWAQLDLSGFPEYESSEKTVPRNSAQFSTQSTQFLDSCHHPILQVFTELLTHAMPIVSAYAHYAHHSLEADGDNDAGIVDRTGWAALVVDCHVCTKAFSSTAAAAVFDNSLAHQSGVERSGLALPAFVEGLVALAFHRANAALLEMGAKVRRGVFEHTARDAHPPTPLSPVAPRLSTDRAPPLLDRPMLQRLPRAQPVPAREAPLAPRLAPRLRPR